MCSLLPLGPVATDVGTKLIGGHQRKKLEKELQSLLPMSAPN